MVLFVGDRPSTKNVDPMIPFIGTKSYDRLLDWASRLGLVNFDMINSHDSALLTIISANAHIKIVIALGNVAARRLDRAGIPHLKMPHPSGRNRKLNDKEYVEQMLWETKQRIELLRPSYLQYYQHPM
jgi:uracil-DNA glycosylase